MNAQSNELRLAVTKWVAQSAPDSESHLTADEIAAYHAGDLPASEEARLRRHLLCCAECTALLLDFERLGTGELGARRDASEIELALAWRGLRSRLGEDSARRVATHTAPLPRWPYALAAALLAAIAGLSLWVFDLRQIVGELTRPRLNAPVHDLYAGAIRGSDSPVSVLALAPEEQVFTLILNLPWQPGQDEYDVDISRTDGEPVWSGSGLRRNAFGSFSLTLSQRRFPAGDYRIRLYHPVSRRDPAVFALRIEHPPAAD